MTTSLFSAIVQAGERSPGQNKVALEANTPCKSLAPVNGRPMVLRVIEALEKSEHVKRVILSGPQERIIKQSPELQNIIDQGRVEWFPPQASPSTSTAYILQQLPEDEPVLLTTSDHALLSPSMVDFFCAQTASSTNDVSAGMATKDTVYQTYPQTKRTLWSWQDGTFCSCNLFAFWTSKGRTAADFWRKIEAKRKNPLKMLQIFGLSLAIRYFLGILTSKECLKQVSKQMGVKAIIIVLPFAEAALDIDSIDDWRLIESIAQHTDKNCYYR